MGGIMGDLGERMEEGRNWLERAAARVPGYRDYKEKELRREADRIQREYVAERLEAARQRLEDVELALSRRGDLGLLGEIDNIARKLRTVKDRFLYADYGYAGLFDAVKVDEAVLEQLYEFDVRSQEQAIGLDDLSRVLAPDSPSLRSDVALLDQRIEALDEYFVQRERVIIGVGRQAL